MTQPLVFLHLSDIHFSRNTRATYDPDLELRRELLTDALELRKEIGGCSGILVSGDIAFAGKSEEYAAGADWLRELCAKLNCAEESVWVIPGNHDVDRDVFRKSSIIQDKHQILRTGNEANGELELQMKRLHDDPEAFDAVHRAFTAYIKFAGGYECIPTTGNLFWEDDLPLNDGSTLRLRGCNSAVASRYEPPDDENENRLVVGRLQTNPLRYDGVTYLLLCHHPLEWLLDRDAIKDNQKAKTSLALFGHKHRQRVERIDDTMFIQAGAVHPERSEHGWNPCYNFIRLQAVGTADKRLLRVEVWPRMWDDVTKKFKPDTYRVEELPLANWSAPPSGSIDGDDRQFANVEITEEGTIVNPKRRLVYRFHTLPYVRKLAIVSRLSLAADTDEDLREEARYPLYFKRAEEMGILDQLWQAVEQQHGVDLPETNPFSRG